MKKIKYGILGYNNIFNEETEKIEREEVVVTITEEYSPEVEERVKARAYNGEYEIYDDGEPEPNPTQTDRIEAQVTYTAMMTDTLLEG